MDALQTTMHGSAAFKVQDRKPSQKRLQPVLAVPLMLLVLASLQAAPNLMPLPAKMVVNPGYLAIDSSFQIASTGLSDARLESAMRRAQLRIFRQLGFATIAARHTVLTIECREAGPAYPALGEDESVRFGRHFPGRAPRRPHCDWSAPRPGDVYPIDRAGISSSGGPYRRSSSLSLARFDAGCLAPLDADRSRKTQSRWPGGSEAQRLPLAPVGRPGLPRGEPAFSQTARTRVGRELLYAGRNSPGGGLRSRSRHPGDSGIRHSWPHHQLVCGLSGTASAPGPYRIERAWGIFQPTIDPTREETYRFLDTLVGEMAALFPDPYFHIGGDEVDDTQWKNSAAIQKFAREHDLATSHAIACLLQPPRAADRAKARQNHDRLG